MSGGLPESPRATAVIVAAGRGNRMGGRTPKQFLDLGGLPVLEWSIRAFAARPEVEEIIVVLPPDVAGRPPAWLVERAEPVPGGETRADSVRRGVAAARARTGYVLIHDGVRPFLTGALLDRVSEHAIDRPTIPVLTVTDTIKRVDERGRVLDTPPRSRLRRAQTPQGFPAELLRAVHGARELTADPSDDALLCERAGHEVVTVAGDPLNIKITSPEDLAWARWLVESGRVRPPAVPAAGGR